MKGEFNLKSSPLAVAAWLDGMEWSIMHEDNAQGSLLLLIGELVYKNELLREAIASKNRAIDLMTAHVMNAQTSACSCSACRELRFVQGIAKLQEAEFTSGRNCFFDESGDIALRRFAT